MSATTSQIIGVSIVCSTVCSGEDRQPASKIFTVVPHVSIMTTHGTANDDKPAKLTIPGLKPVNQTPMNKIKEVFKLPFVMII